MTLLFCNIGWMEHYNGQNKSDVIIGGGSHVKPELSVTENANLLASALINVESPDCRKLRNQYASQLGYDINRIFQDIQKRQLVSPICLINKL